jgi:hypothetical protein
MHNISRSILGGLAFASLASCGPTIRSDRDESVPVPQGATWAWADADTAADARAASPVGEIVEQRFRRAIEATMQAKGYRQIAEGPQADFVLAAQFGEPAADIPRHRSTGIGVGLSTGWGYGPWGVRRVGFYRPWGPFGPWGFYQPWGWGFYGAPLWGGYAWPAYGRGRRAYSDGALVIVLRSRNGEVAWSGRLGSDALASQRLTQDRVQRLTTRLFESLR